MYANKTKTDHVNQLSIWFQYIIADIGGKCWLGDFYLM